MELIELIIGRLIEFGILFFELVGMLILFVAGLRAATVGIFRKGLHTSRTLARGMAMSLEFMMGAEILRTVQTRELRDLFLIAGIVVVRMALTVLIGHDIKEADEFMETYEKEKEAEEVVEEIIKERAATAADEEKNDVTDLEDLIR